MAFCPAGRLRRAGAQQASGLPPSVSVIIPARNEEHNLPTLLRSLASQPVKPREIIVVDDGSTDRTAELARQLGATVIASQAAARGLARQDVGVSPGRAGRDRRPAVVPGRRYVVRAGRAWPAFSPATPAAPSPSAPTTPSGSRTKHLSLFFNFNMTVGTVPDGLFGQMLLVDRESYRRVGGHETVRGRILENFWLAGQFRAAGIPVRSATGRGVFSFRMYPNGLRELIEGWTKGFAVRGRADAARDHVRSSSRG